MTEKKKNGGSAAPDPGNVLFVVYVGFVICVILLGMAVDGYSGELPDSPVQQDSKKIRQGELLYAGDDGKLIRAPQLSQEVEIYISAMTARTMVRQRFINNTRSWQEAVYVFPLPDESAVDQLLMRIGERVIVGDIKEKEEAKKIYETAKKEGKKASLLSQERPNIFTMAVSNIGPGEEIEIEIEFQQVVRLDSGVFSLRFPMVAGPRYIPGAALSNSGEDGGKLQFSGSGWAVDTDRVPDASRITPPVALKDEPERNPIRLMVELAAGFPLARVESLYHGITVSDGVDGVKLLHFDGVVKADRDFVLEWEAAELTEPRAALFGEEQGDDSYLLLMLSPPAQPVTEEALPRDMVFVLDTSGSMAGPSIGQAREALILAISRLGRRDRFNVIEFNSNAVKLFDHSVAADAENKERAVDFVRSLEAQGGTEIARALDLVLDGREDHGRIRQIMFLTDGSVGNEEELLKMISSRLGGSRLFTVGIGSAPNAYFMSRAAAMGRGSYTYIGHSREVQQKMRELFRKLEHPAITDIVVKSSSGRKLEYYPGPVPDLYAGEPLLVSLKLPGGVAEEGLEISGRMGMQLWQEKLSLQQLAGRPGVAGLWARKKIRSIMDSSAQGVAEESIRRQVVSIALEHHLVSKYTSLVAVEEKPSRPVQEKYVSSALKNNLPHGWQADAIFGGTARTATPAQLRIITGLLLLLAAFFLCFRKRLFR